MGSFRVLLQISDIYCWSSPHNRAGGPSTCLFASERTASPSGKFLPPLFANVAVSLDRWRDLRLRPIMGHICTGAPQFLDNLGVGSVKTLMFYVPVPFSSEIGQNMCAPSDLQRLVYCRIYQEHPCWPLSHLTGLMHSIHLKAYVQHDCFNTLLNRKHWQQRAY